MYALGPAHLDSEKQLLTIDGRAVALQRKPFLVLLYLVENRHRMIYRKELLDRFWDGKEVYDQSLSKAIGSIRKAFGEVGTSSEFIETRWGLGYRYVGPFGEASPVPSSNLSVPAHESPASQTDEVEISAAELTHAASLLLPDNPAHPIPSVPPPVASRQNPLTWLLGASAIVVMLCIAAAVHFHDAAPIKRVAANAQQVSSKLLPQLGMESVKETHQPDTNNQNAYNRYMKAKFFANMRTQNSLAKAIDLLNEAILIDPEYAPAYAALADCYQLQGFYHFASPSDAYPRAKTAAQKALSLDRSIAEAHASLLSIYADYDWDWPGVEREFKAIVAIDPNYAVAYQYYGYGLLGMGRGEEALVAMKHAADLDPVSPSVQTSLAWAYYLLRHDELAVDQCKRVLEMYPDFVPAHQLLGIVYGQMGADQRALAELNEAETLERDGSITPILLDYELARTGKRAEAARNLENVLAKSRGASIPDYYMAAAWTAIGDKQEALLFLDRAYRFRSNWVSYLQYDPRFDGLRSEPQFKALLNRVAFSPNDSLAMQH
jgi:DNA-binding winged helix-turn-helix (wHTH) protein/tetratricopeptide (TPR) repeat protein